MKKKKQKFFSLFLSIALLFSVFQLPLTAFAADLGSGTMEIDADGSYLIKTAEDLISLSSTSADLSKNYRLANDIDLAGKTVPSIGKFVSTGNSQNRGLTGTFDGNGKTLSNLSQTGQGLFTFIDAGGVVKNLTLANFTIHKTDTSSDGPGALAQLNSGTIIGCYSVDSSVVTEKSSVTGGLVGLNKGTIEKSGVDGGTVTANGPFVTTVGGFVGRNLGKIDQCFATATVTAQRWRAGGFAGGQEGGEISNCYTTGDVSIGEQAGGFAGYFTEDTQATSCQLTNVYASNHVTSTTGGPLVGSSGYYSPGTITNGYFNTEKTAPDSELIVSPTGATGKTASEMQTEAFRAALGDSSIWSLASGVNGGLPYLTNTPPLSRTPKPTVTSVQVLVVPYDYTSYQFQSASPISVELTGDADHTVKDVLDQAAADGKLSFSGSNGSYGYFVESINGVSPETPNGWMFTVNDAPGNVGASAAIIKNGDKIMWYEGTTSNFYKAPTWNDITNPSSVTFIDISSAQQLLALANSANPTVDWAKNYRLVENIDLQKAAFSPIGSDAVPFSGIFDGNGKTISGLSIRKGPESQNLGLFGCILGATIRNVTLENAEVVGGSILGLLVGQAKVELSSGTANLIGNCQVSGTIEGTGTSVIKQTDIGGLIGVNGGESDNYTGNAVNSTVDGCSANVTVTGSAGTAANPESGHTGGFVGWNKGIITSCSAQGNVSGGNTTGGFVGTNFGSIYKCHATGNVISGYTAGGFAGSSGLYTHIENSYATGNVLALPGTSSYYFGGFAGSISGTVKNCVSTGTLTPGWSYNGGFAGTFDGTLFNPVGNATLQSCFGNAETSLGTRVKGLGNYIDGHNESSNQAAASVGLTKAEAEQKLEELLHAIAKQEADLKALKAEASKYETLAIVPGDLEKDSDITSFIVQPKAGQQPASDISVQYRTKDDNRHIASNVTASRYLLSEKNEGKENVTENVVLLFTKDGETYAHTVTTVLRGAQTDATVNDVLSSIAGKYQALTYQGTDYDWYAFDMALYGNASPFVSEKAKVEFINASIAAINPAYGTDYARVALMMTALGVDAQGIIDTLSEAELHGINAQIYALLAYDCGDYTVTSSAPNNREAMLSAILSRQNADGGWAYAAGDPSEASMTAMAISALAPYRDRAEVGAAVTAAVDCLSAMQGPTGGYISWGSENSNDAAMVVIALTALGIDPATDSRFVKNGSSVIDNLLSFVTDGKEFGYTDNASANPLATEQGFRALVAYRGLKAGGFNIYRFEKALAPLPENVPDALPTGDGRLLATACTVTLLAAAALPLLSKRKKTAR